MRVLAAAVAVLLFVAISSVAGGSLRNSTIAASSQKQETTTICCFSYVSRRVPLSLIHSAYTTSNSCPNPAVILVTRKGRNMCVDPKAPWVKKYLERFELPEH